MKQNPKILYIGSLQKHTNSFARFQTLQELGCTVEGIDIDPLLFEGNKLYTRMHHFLNWGPGIISLNRLVIEKSNTFKPDLIWMDNKPFLSKSTLIRLKETKSRICINVVTDDAFGDYSTGWRLLKSTMNLYDVHFVQRKQNIEEYLKLGAKRVLECDRSFNPKIHHPVNLTQDEVERHSCKVGFIGTYAKHRSDVICNLIKKGISVSVWGSHWIGKPGWKIIEPHFKGKDVYGEEYSKILCGMDIALHFLRKENRDDQDSRTFEIPACGTFMLAERTEKHVKYFQEGIEAEFFESETELEEKIKFYLLHSDVRKKIAEAGLKRCNESGYSHQGRLMYILSQI